MYRTASPSKRDSARSDPGKLSEVKIVEYLNSALGTSWYEKHRSAAEDVRWMADAVETVSSSLSELRGPECDSKMIETMKTKTANLMTFINDSEHLGALLACILQCNRYFVRVLNDATTTDTEAPDCHIVNNTCVQIWNEHVPALPCATFRKAFTGQDGSLVSAAHRGIQKAMCMYEFGKHKMSQAKCMENSNMKLVACILSLDEQRVQYRQECEEIIETSRLETEKYIDEMRSDLQRSVQDMEKKIKAEAFEKSVETLKSLLTTHGVPIPATLLDDLDAETIQNRDESVGAANSRSPKDSRNEIQCVESSPDKSPSDLQTSPVNESKKSAPLGLPLFPSSASSEGPFRIRQNQRSNPCASRNSFEGGEFDLLPKTRSVSSIMVRDLRAEPQKKLLFKLKR